MMLKIINILFAVLIWILLIAIKYILLKENTLIYLMEKNRIKELNSLLYIYTSHCLVIFCLIKVLLTIAICIRSYFSTLFIIFCHPKTLSFTFWLFYKVFILNLRRLWFWPVFFVRSLWLFILFNFGALYIRLLL